MIVINVSVGIARTQGASNHTKLLSLSKHYIVEYIDGRLLGSGLTWPLPVVFQGSMNFNFA
jgi:hypothetical protein